MKVSTPQRGGRNNNNNNNGGGAIPGLLARRGIDALSTPPTTPPHYNTSPIHQQQQQRPRTHFLSLLDLLSEIPDLSVLHRAFVSEARGFHSKRAVVPLPPNNASTNNRRSSLNNNNTSPSDTPRPIVPQPPPTSSHRRKHHHTARSTPQHQQQQNDNDSMSGSFRSSASFRRPPPRSPSSNSNKNATGGADLLEREDAVVGIVPTHQESELGIPMSVFTTLLLTYCKSLHTTTLSASHGGGSIDGVKSLGGTGGALYAAFANSEHDDPLLPRIHHSNHHQAATTTPTTTSTFPAPSTHDDPSVESALHALFSEVDRNGDGLVSWNDVYTYSFDSGQAALDLESATLDSHGSSKFSLSKQLWRSDNIYLCKYLPCTDIKLYQLKHGHASSAGGSGNQPKLTKSAAAAKLAMEAAANAKHNLDQLIFADSSPTRGASSGRSRAGSVGGSRPRGASVTDYYNDGIRSRAGSVTSISGNKDAPSMTFSGSSAYFPPHRRGSSNYLDTEDEDGGAAVVSATAAAQKRRATRSILASLHRRRLRLYQRAVVRIPTSAEAVLRNESTGADKNTQSGTVGNVSGLFEGAGYSRIYGDPSSEDSPILDEEKEEDHNDEDPQLEETSSEDDMSSFSHSISMSGSMTTSPRNNKAMGGGGSMMMNSAADFTRTSSSHALFPARHLKGIKLSGSLSRQNSTLEANAKAKAAAATSSNNLMKSMMSSSFHVTTLKVGPIVSNPNNKKKRKGGGGGASQELLFSGDVPTTGDGAPAPMAKPYLKQSCFSHSTILSKRTRVEKIARVYARSRRQEIALLANHNKEKQHKNSSGRGDRIIVCSRHSPLQLLDAKTLRPVASFDEFLQPLRSTAVSAHGSEGNTRNAYFHTYDAIYGGNTDDKMSLGAGYDPNAKSTATTSSSTSTSAKTTATPSSSKMGGGAAGVMSTSAANYSSTSEYFRFPDTNTRIVCADYLPSISTLVAFASDMKLRAWLYNDSRPDIPVLRPLLCDFYVTCMRAAPYSSFLMAGGSDQYADEDNDNDGEEDGASLPSSNSSNQISLLYTGDRGGRITLYEINRQTLNEPRVVDGFYLHRANVGGVSCFCFVGDGAGGVAEKGVVRRIVSAGMDNDLLLTDIVTRKSTVIANTPCAIKLMEFVAPIHSVAAVGIDNSIGLWVTHQSRRPCTPLVDHSDPHMSPIVGLEVPSCTTPYFTRNGSTLGATEASNSALSTDHHIITTDRSGMVKVWDVRTFKCVQTWRVGRGGTEDAMGAAGGKAHNSRSAATAAAKSAGGAAAAGAGSHDGGGGEMAEADEERIVWDGSTSDDDDTASNHSHGSNNSSVEDISGLSDHKHRNNNKGDVDSTTTSPRRTLAGAKRAQQSDGANQQHHQRPSLLSKRNNRKKTTPSHGEGIVIRNSSSGGGSNLPNQLDTVVAGGSTAPAGVNATAFCGASRELICATPKGLVCYRAGRGRNKDVADDTAQTLAVVTVPRPAPPTPTTLSLTAATSTPIQLDEAGMPDVVTISARSLRFWKVGRQQEGGNTGSDASSINFQVAGAAADTTGPRGDQNKGRLFLLQDRPKQQISMSSLQTRYENLTTFVSVLRPHHQQQSSSRTTSTNTNTTNSCPFTEREYIQFNSRQNEISCCCLDASGRRVFLGYASGDIEEVGVRGGSKLNVRHLGDDQIVRAMAGIDTAGMMLARNKKSTDLPSSTTTTATPKVSLSSLHLDIVFLAHSDVFKVLVAATGNGYLVLDSLPGDKPLPPGHRKRAALASAALNDAAAAAIGGGVDSKSSSRVWLKVLAQKRGDGQRGDRHNGPNTTRNVVDRDHPESITALAISSKTTGYVVAGTNTGRIVLVDVYSPRVVNTEFNASLVLDVLLKEREAAEQAKKKNTIRMPLDSGLVTVTAPDAPTPPSLNSMPPGGMLLGGGGEGSTTNISLLPQHYNTMGNMNSFTSLRSATTINSGNYFPTSSSSSTPKLILEALHHNLASFTTPTLPTALSTSNYNDDQPSSQLGASATSKKNNGMNDLTPYTLAGTDPPSSVRDVCFIHLLGGGLGDDATPPNSTTATAVAPTADDDEIIATLHKNGYVMFWTLSDTLLRAAAGVGCLDGFGGKGGGAKNVSDHNLPTPVAPTNTNDNNPPPRPPTNNNSMRGSRVGIVKQQQHQQPPPQLRTSSTIDTTIPTPTNNNNTTSIPADRPKGGLLYVAHLSSLILAGKRYHSNKKEEVAEIADAAYEAASLSPRRLLLAAGRGDSASPRRRIQMKKKNPKVMFHVVGGSDDTIADTDSKNNKDKDIPRNEDGEEEVDIKPNNMRYAEELSSLIVTDVSGYVSIVRIDNLLAVLRGLRAGLEIATATNTTTTTSSSPKKKGHNTAASVVPTDQYNGAPLFPSSTFNNNNNQSHHNHQNHNHNNNLHTIPTDMTSFEQPPPSISPTSQRLSIGSLGNTFGMSSFWGAGASTKFDEANAAAAAWPALPRHLAGKQPPRISTAALLKRPGNANHHQPTTTSDGLNVVIGHDEMDATSPPLPPNMSDHNFGDSNDNSPLNPPPSQQQHRGGVVVVEEPLSHTAALRGIYDQYCDMRRKRSLSILDTWLSHIITTTDPTPEGDTGSGVVVASNPVEVLRGLHYALEHSIKHQLPSLLLPSTGGAGDDGVQWGRDADPLSYDHLMGLVELLWGRLPNVVVPPTSHPQAASLVVSSRPLLPRPPLPPPHQHHGPHPSTSTHNISIGSEHHSTTSVGNGCGGQATFNSQEAAELLLDSKETYEILRHSPALWFGGLSDPSLSLSSSTAPSQMMIEASLVTVSESFRAHAGDILALDVTPNLQDKTLIHRAEAPLVAAAHDQLARLPISGCSGDDDIGGSGMWGLSSPSRDYSNPITTDDIDNNNGVSIGDDDDDDTLRQVYRSVFVYSVGNDHKARQWCVRAVDTSTQSAVEALHQMLPPRKTPPLPTTTTSSHTYGCYHHADKKKDSDDHNDEVSKTIFLSRLRSTAAGLLLTSGTGKAIPSSTAPTTTQQQQQQQHIGHNGGGVSADGSWDIRVLLSDNLSPDTPAPSILPPPPTQPTPTAITASPTRRGSSANRQVSPGGIRRKSSRDGSPSPSAPTSASNPTPTTLGSYFLPRLRTGSLSSRTANTITTAAGSSRRVPPSSSPSRNGRRATMTTGGGSSSTHAPPLLSSPPPLRSKGASTTLGPDDRHPDGGVGAGGNRAALSRKCSLPQVLRLGWLLLSNNNIVTTPQPRLMSGGGMLGTRGDFDDDHDEDDDLHQVLPSRVRHFVLRVLTYNPSAIINGLMGAAAFPPPSLPAGAGAGSASSQFAQVPQRHLSISGLQSTPLQYLPTLATPTPPTTNLGGPPSSSSPATTPMLGPKGITRTTTTLSPRVVVSMSPRTTSATTTTTAHNNNLGIDSNNEQLATLYSQTDRVHHKELKRDKEVRHIRNQARRLSMSLSATLQQQRRSTLHHQGGGGGSSMGSGLAGGSVGGPSSLRGSGVVGVAGSGGADVFLMGHSSINHTNNHNATNIQGNNQTSPSTSQNPLQHDGADGEDISPPPPNGSIHYSDIQALQQQVDDVVFKSAQERRQLKLRQRRLRKLEGGASSSSSEVSVTVGNDGGGDNIDEFLDDDNSLLIYGSDVGAPPPHHHDGGGGGVSPGASSAGCASSRNSPFGHSMETPLLYSDGTVATTDNTTTTTTSTPPHHPHLHVVAPIADAYNNNNERGSPVRVAVDRASSLWDAYYSPSPLRQSK